MQLRVLVADDHPLYREGVVEALRRHDDLEVVAAAGDGEEALARIRSLGPDVAVLDASMPGLGAQDIVERLAADGVPTRVLVLSAHTEGERVHALLEAGAAGYLTKDSDRSTICDAVRRIGRGDSVIGAEVQGVLLDREQQVLEHLAEGLSSTQIAERLVISPTTVKTHLAHLYEKLGVSERAAAVAEAMRRGLLR